MFSKKMSNFQRKTFFESFSVVFVKLNYLPVQETPLPAKPELQVQENPPFSSVHVARGLQLSVFLAHSLISIKQKEEMITLENHIQSKV